MSVKAHRAYHFGHAIVAGPLLGGTEESVGHLAVVHEVHESETGLLAACG